MHVSNLYTTGPALELAGKLTGDRFAAVQYMNSGAEANESALKFARMYAHRGEKNAERHKILAFTGGFHGRTYGALACTATPKYQEPFRPMLPDVEIAPYNDVEALRKTLDGTFAGVIVEVVQGEGGLQSMTPEVRGRAQRLPRRARPHPDRGRGAGPAWDAPATCSPPTAPG